MDPVIHTLLAITVAEAAGAAGPNEAALVSAAIGGALAADTDFALRPFGPTLTLRYHHGPTHSLFGGVFLSGICAMAVVFISWLIQMNWAPSLILCWSFAYLGFLSHIALDLTLHCNGLQILWPLSGRWFRMPLFVGLNPVTSSTRCAERSLIVCWLCQLHSLIHNRILYILLFGAVLQVALWPWREPVARLILMAAGLYAFYAYSKKGKAKNLAQNIFPSARNLEVFPSGFNTNRWLALGHSRTTYELVHINLQNGYTGPRTTFTDDSAPEVKRALQSEKVRATLNNFIVPHGAVHRRRDGVREVHFRDLAYYFTPEVPLHLAKVELDESDVVKSVDFRERW